MQARNNDKNRAGFSQSLRHIFGLYLLVWFACLAQQLSAQIAVPGPGAVVTIAGNGTAGYSGDGGAATSALVSQPGPLVVDANGNIYFADAGNKRIRKVTASTGIITTIAGTGTSGFTGDGGAAISAEIGGIDGIALDSSGNIYIADPGYNRVRKITISTGKISTVAGNGSFGKSGDGGAATAAQLNGPAGLAVDSSGNLYIADYGNSLIRKVAASTQIITTVAGSYTTGYTGDGGPATTAELFYPKGVAVDAAGNFYIDDWVNDVIRKVTVATGIITTVAGSSDTGATGDGGLATDAALTNPTSIAIDRLGNLYIATDLGKARKVAAATGIITTIATIGAGGDGGSGNLTVNSSGVVYFAEPYVAASYPTNIVKAAGQVKTAPPITWPTPAAITYGTALSATQLNASTGGIAGTFAYSPAAGAVLAAGAQTLSVTFTPTTDTIDYSPSTATVTLMVNMAVPPLTWTAPAAVTYGTPLSATQLNASSTLPGTYAYSPAAGTVLAVGVHTLSLTFTPGDAVDYAARTATVNLTVAKTGSVTAVTSNLNPSIYGQDVTFQSPISTGGGTPTGTVTFKDGSTTLGTGTVGTVSATNLVPYSQQIGIQSWQGYCGANMSNLSANSADLAAPDGSATATKVVIPATIACGSAGTWGAIGIIPGGLVAGTTYTASVWLRGLSGGEVVAFGLNDCAWADVTLSNTWQRYTFTYPAISSAIVNCAGGPRGLQVADNSVPNSTYYVWGAQVERAASAGPYIQTLATAQAGVGGTATFTKSGFAGGAHSITAVYAGDANDLGSTSSALSQAVNPATPVITWPNPAAISVGTPLSATQLDASAGSVAGTFTYSPAAGTQLAAGTQTLTVTFTPTTLANYSVTTAHATLVVDTKTTPTLVWANPVAITYGTALSGTQLNATTSPTVPGTYAYSPAAGTILTAGAKTLSVLFTPTDGTTYNTISKTVTLAVTSAPVNWTLTASPSPAVAFHPVTLSIQPCAATGTMTFYAGTKNLGTSPLTPGACAASQINFVTSAIPAGSQSITAVYSGDQNYAGSTQGPVALTVSKATPVMSWATPAAIVYGTALSATQLDASSGGVAGTYTYAPASGVIPSAGSQTLSVSFAPTDTADYNTATASATLLVSAAVPTLTIGTSGSPSSENGSVRFTATISNGLTGTVTFLDGATVIGSGTISGTHRHLHHHRPRPRDALHIG